jgi:phosphatidyl-myo-inositol dimannoside synthase
LLALNDATVPPADLLRCGNGQIDASAACNRNKVKFVREALRMSRGCDEIVCGHVFMLPVAWMARRLNPQLRYHLVAHGIDVWRRFTVAERVALRGATTIFCVSDYTRRELLKNCPLPEGRAVVLPNALDPTFEIAAGRPLAQCEPVILLVTRLTYNDRYKGVEHMIGAMPAIRQAMPAARLRIVGRGDDLPRLRALSEKLGVSDAIDFLGYLPDVALEREFHACRLFALPSKKEGFGLVFLEAMAQGRPCLGVRAGGVPEVITPDTGVLVDYGDVAGIAAASVAALQRAWNEEAILDRARHFAYAPFKERLRPFLVA